MEKMLGKPDGNIVGNPLGTYRNIVRTHWELIGNTLGTRWEPGKNGKKKPPQT
jgi:hypothetical protein